MKSANITIRSATPGVAFSIQNSVLERVEEGVTPADVMLDPGLYAVKTDVATGGEAQPQFIELQHGKRYVLQLGPSASGLREDTRGPTSRAFDFLKSKARSSQVASPTAAVETEATTARVTFPQVWIRFRKLKNWTETEAVEPQDLRSWIEGDCLWIEVALPVNAVVFAQAMMEDQPPLNTALPGGGLNRTRPSRLKLSYVEGRLMSEVHFHSSVADQAADYVRIGNFEQAKKVLGSAQLPAPSLLEKALNYLKRRFEDPATTALKRYALLRTGDLNWLKNFPDSLLNAFDWLADGYVVSGELAARDGNAPVALMTLTHVREGLLPLYTDGFSMLLSRLLQFTREPDSMKPMKQELQHLVDKARELLSVLQRWAPHLHMDALTLTFSGVDLANPAETQNSVTPAEDWIKLDAAMPDQTISKKGDR